MPPILAFILCLSFVIVVLRYDKKMNPETSLALWVPLIWLLLVSTRNPSQWISNLQTGLQPAEQFTDYMQGNSTDRIVFMLLIALGFLILFKRGVKWASILKENWIIFLFLGFCGLSILWSDFAAVAFKRWIKGLGDYVMALVVLTEAIPVEAIKTIIRRCAIILFPFSILLIRYFPYGRIYTPWGESEYVGVATSKNTLGTVCLVLGLYLFWSLMTKQIKREGSYDKKELLTYLFYLFLIAWLFKYAPSLTSEICLVLGVLLLWFLNSDMVRRNSNYIGYIFFYGLIILFAIQATLDLVPNLLTSFQRDATLTGRVPLWNYLMGMDLNVWFGTGYESFWLGDRLQDIWEIHWWMPNQAHNGFLETYLNLGRVGLILLLGILYSTYRKSKKGLTEDYDFGIFRIAALFVIIIFNQVEAAFKVLHIMWFLLLLITFEYKRGQRETI